MQYISRSFTFYTRFAIFVFLYDLCNLSLCSRRFCVHVLLQYCGVSRVKSKTGRVTARINRIMGRRNTFHGVLWFFYTRGVQKVLQLNMMHKSHKQFFMLLFNIITLNTNAYVTFIKQLFNASQIEFLLHALQVRLRGLFDLVIIFEPRIDGNHQKIVLLLPI